MAEPEHVISTPIPPEAFQRLDESPDPMFYQMPRFVTHIDESAIDAVRQLYREYLVPGTVILDMMSSWVSHLPAEVTYSRVAGFGLNEEELRANNRLDAWTLHDLNEDARLPYRDTSFDGATICVAVDYLARPVDVLRDLGRVLRPDSPLVITYSNRCFPTKVVAIWQLLDDKGHVALVRQYLNEAGNWDRIETLDRSPVSPLSDPLFAVIARKRGD